MVCKIIWTTTARADYFKIVDYLQEEWGQKSVLKFEGKVMKQLDLISKMPKLYSETEFRENVRRCLVVNQVSLYYLEIEQKAEIIVLRLLDNRQNPDKLPDLIP